MSGILRDVSVVGKMTGISRLAGLVREMLMAQFFGTGLAKSAFDVAFRIPNLFRRLFGEGALSAAFIPIYTETLEREGVAEANRLAGRVAGLLLAVLGSITALGILAALALQQSLPASSRWVAILPLLRIMLPYAPLICLAALCMGVLNSLRHFAMPALAPLFLNLVWIVVLLAICPFLPDDPFLRMRAVAWGVIVAGVLQVAVQFPALRRRGVQLRLGGVWRGDERVRRIVKLMAPMALGAGLIQINVTIDGFLAMWVGTWGPAAMEYAERLVYLPLGIIGNAFATVLLPTFSGQAAQGNHDGLRETLERALRNIAVIMTPAAVGLTLLARPVTELLFCLGGKFDADSACYTSRALAGYAPGLLIFSFQKVVTPVFYALQDTRTPTRIGVVGVLLNFCLNILFIVTWPAGWKHMGIAAATVLTSLVNSITLVMILRRRAQAPSWRALAGTYAGTLAAAAVMGWAVFTGHAALLGRLQALLPLKLAQVLAMAASLAVGAGLYLLLVRLFCRRALTELRADWRQRGSRKAAT